MGGERGEGNGMDSAEDDYGEGEAAELLEEADLNRVLSRGAGHPRVMVVVGYSHYSIPLGYAHRRNSL